ncbi:N-methylhydantoinase A [Xanthobacter sp. SG618]|uniref:hydantoinase/oxoprolinase family protein n=1 Tax=Xanthobacter sp. SG618 TaxID=2587121 RepID=UPI00145D5419|nr:hydantoinase/oxoprolinase family protein [Xanthobacter sp. SG618]NMN57460.1 N-methylhydantoinase A [Xanthobacter sp. SG618]
MAWLGVDVGGTFTDLVLFDRETARLEVLKTPSTPKNQADGILTGVERLALDPASLERMVHGTTVATNTALERDGPRLAVVSTRGHRDVLVVGRGNRMAMYNIKAPPNRPLIPRSQCFEVDERIKADGSIHRPLDERQAEELGDLLSAEGYTAVAVCFINAYANPAHERRCAEILAAKLPGASITTSSAVLPEYREYERFSTAALNAYVGPRMRHYVGDLRGRLEKAGMRAPLTIMSSNGGSLPAKRIEELPVLSMLSGPAAGVIAATHVGRAAGVPDLITCDMGGTSTDVCLVRGGEFDMTTEGRVGAFPVKIRQIDINTIAVAGGSIASATAGFLKVGPRSSASMPGPASFGRGGQEATVTDANVVLGRLRTDRPLGGEIHLDRAAAVEVVGRLAAQLGLSVEAMAEGILRIAAVSLAGAIKEVSVMRGIDPRDFALLPFGGAGALHAVDVAVELGMKTVLVPPLPGNFSAFGLLVADLRRDLVQTRVVCTDEAPVAAVRDQLKALVADAQEELAEAGYGADRTRFSASLDMRYAGQSFELSVPVALDVADMAEIEQAFARVYAARYGAPTAARVEIVSYRVAAWGLSEKPVLPPVDPTGRGLEAARTGTGEVVFGGIAHPTQILARDLLPPGMTLEGPALIEEAGSTTVVPPGWTVALDAIGCLVMRQK